MKRRAFLSSGLAASAAAVTPAFAQARPFANAIAYSAEHAGAAIHIMRNGVLWAEDYPNRGEPASLRGIGGATLSFLPALVSALAADRMLSIDEPAAWTLVEWMPHPVKSQITLRMILNQTCGLAGGRPLSTFDSLALEPVAHPGERFIRDDAPVRIFVEIARRKLMSAGLGPDPAGYVSARALAPVGCAPISWRRDANGDADFLDGASITTSAWARWGELMRRVGVWRAAPLIDGETLRDACRGSWVQPRFGFGLWLAWPSRDPTPVLEGCDLWSSASAAPSDLVMAASANGDRLYVLPTQRLVIARQATQAQNWSDAAFLALLLAEA